MKNQKSVNKNKTRKSKNILSNIKLPFNIF